ncbi:hypothetical protein SUDANB176_02923 [Streptomyces sp. enrichment culture]|uniref:DNRLRE domain-containing protein n=1 Tax=Streptomyces sp. enrichment culture TaxID=1795815 RepID=UPI003F572C65
MDRLRSLDPRTGRPGRRRRARSVAVPLALALLTQTALALGVAPASSAAGSDPSAPADAPVAPAAQREEANARVTAQAQGRRIEVTGARTEYSTLWANPDGTMTVKTSAGPVRYREKGHWVDVDLTLVRNPDGSVSPKGHPGGLRMAGRTGKAGGDLVTLGRGEKEVSLGWKGALPEPRLDGNEATYENVLPGADLVVRATRTGFEEFLVVADREAAERVATLTLPVRTKGLKAKEGTGGGLVLNDSRTGEEAGRTPTPFMWDSSASHPDAPDSRTARVDLDVTDREDGFDLVVKADQDFLADEDTRYPVTIDPAVYLTSNLDTEVVQGDISDHSADYGLNVGREYGKTPARAFINFPRSYSYDMTGQDILNAELDLYTLWSDVCTQQPWEIWDTTSVTASATWDSTQTAWRTKVKTSLQTFGGPGCDAQWINEDITGLVKQWSKTSKAVDTIGLRAQDEDNTDQFKIFASSDSEHTPDILVTYEPVTDPSRDHIDYWNDVLLQTFRQVGGAPGPLSRAGAMVHGAIYDAVNSARCAESSKLCLGEAYLVKATASNGAVPDVNSAIDQAAYAVLSSVYPALDFSDELATARSTIPAAVTSAQRTAGTDVGQKAATAMINARQNDGSGSTAVYTGSQEPGFWRPTNNDDQGNPVTGATPEWGKVKPFALQSGSQFRPSGPGGHTQMSTLLASQEYADQVNEVKEIGGTDSTTRTPDQTEAAKFWANDLDGTYKPPGQLLEQTQTVARNVGVSTPGKAKLLAHTAFAMADAAIVAWDTKYLTDIDLWRPESAINVGQGNTDWRPLSPNVNGEPFSPDFPAYVSGHATFAGAWAQAMRDWFGTDAISWTATTDDPNSVGVTRNYSSFSQAAEENATARVWLGVHYRWDGTEGVSSGGKAAAYLAANKLKPNTSSSWVAYDTMYNLNGCEELGKRLVAEHRWTAYECRLTVDPEHILYVK